jgi:hypothetical protein
MLDEALDAAKGRCTFHNRTRAAVRIAAASPSDTCTDSM